MNYGFFDDINREYVIETPQTPFPWINYFGNDDFFSLMSNTSGGYCFYRDAKLRRITRYRYNNIPIDCGGRYFYINDGGDCWSNAWMPIKKELDFYECRHGLGYSQITSERGGLRIKQLSFVPLGFNGEVHQIKVQNTSKQTKAFTLFSFVEFCLWNANDDMTNFQRNLSIGEVEVEGSVIYHKTEYRERRDHYSFYSVNSSIDGFDTDRDSFLGQFNGLDAPQVVFGNKSNNSMASGWYPIASHELKVILEPGSEKSFNFVLGYVENKQEEKWESHGVINKTRAKEMTSQFSSKSAVDEALSELKAYWDNLLQKYYLESQDEKLNRMVNIWNPYQCMVTFNMSRSASYFESGIGRGMGFRDSNQDILGFVHLIPDKAKERIIDIASTQFEDGGAYHQYQPLTKMGNNDIGGGFNDDPLWLILSTAAYIKETGDFSILDVQVPFDNDENNKASLFEHLKRSFYHVINNLGPHNLPLIGRADWNDCLNLNCFSTTPDESYQTCGIKDGRVAESVFIAGLFVLAGSDFVKICNSRNQQDEAKKAVGHIDEMIATVLKDGYDESWFLRAYDNLGAKIGSEECEEGKIFIEPQGMCIMAGIGVDNGLAIKALDSVKEKIDTKYGIVLQSPPYSKYYPNLGEISSYPEGYKENAGIFCHNNPWIAMAETELGRGDRAFEIYSKIAPAYLEEISEIHKMEPYVYSQMIAGRDAIRHGEAKNSWLTGTASWNYIAISQSILGIKPDFNGLKIDPCIPKEWDEYKISRNFRGAIYNITIINHVHVSKGIKYITVNREEIEGNILPVLPEKSICDVTVILG